MYQLGRLEGHGGSAAVHAYKSLDNSPYMSDHSLTSCSLKRNVQRIPVLYARLFSLFALQTLSFELFRAWALLVGPQAYSIQSKDDWGQPLGPGIGYI